MNSHTKPLSPLAAYYASLPKRPIIAGSAILDALDAAGGNINAMDPYDHGKTIHQQDRQDDEENKDALWR